MTDEHNNILVATTNSNIISSSNNNNSNSSRSSSIHHHHLHRQHQPQQQLNHSAIEKHVDAASAPAATTKPLPSTSPPTKDSIIAEAAKILLKNGSTAAAAAAATLLTAAATFQLPAPRPSSRLAPPTTEHHTPHQHQPAANKQHHHHHRNHTPPPAHSGGSSPGAVASGAIDVSARRHHPLPPRKFLNNGTSAAPAAQTSAPTKPTMAATTTTPGAAQMRLGMSSPAAAHLGGAGGAASASSSGKAPAELGAGAIDYTFHAAAAAAVSASVFGGSTNNHHKYPLHGGGGPGNCRTELGRHSSVLDSGGSGPGGRLQFFKDGKFILELARSKDGDGKGGWVSVPRKLFRTPSAATSSTVTPTLATTTAYPKNESSTSLSFSDDNSSLQSSPWQRDHCWKQAAPRRGISHEMALYFWRPRGLIALTSQGLQVAHRKRRRPLDPPPNGEQRHFECRLNKSQAPETMQKGAAEESPSAASSPKGQTDTNGVKEEVEMKETAAACSPPQDGGEPTDKDNGDEPVEAAASNKMDISGDEELLATGADVAPKSPAKKNDKMDKEAKQEEESKEEEPRKESEAKSEEPNEQPATAELVKSPKSDSQPSPKEVDAVEKMNTSEDDVDVSVAEGDSPSKAVNGHEPSGEREKEETASSVVESERPPTPAAKEEPLAKSEESVAHTNGTPPEDTAAKPAAGKPAKPRAKLNTIIQKLIDSMPAKVAAPAKLLPSASSSSSATAAAANNTNSHHNNSKVSPTTAAPASSTAAGSASASRLVDYHQQHVSPRKRILRDLEKVSLEDSGNNCGSAAGGKRSRAKGNSVAVPIPTTAASPRGHATGGTAAGLMNGGHASYPPPHYGNNKMLYPQAEATPKGAKSTGGSSTTTTTTTTVAAASAAAASATPTRRLYSSYSIHSLLGGGSGSSSSSSTACSSSSPANSKRPPGSDQAVVSSSSSSNYAQQQQQYTDPSYLRNMLASPKSPEAGHGSASYGGKSPSSSASRRQRSPPYPPSPMHEAASRSPAASHAEFGRRSPRATPPDAGHKQATQQQLLNAANANSQMALGPQHAAFYSQYLMASPKYPPAGASSPAGVARSPGHGAPPTPSGGYSGAPSSAGHSHAAHQHQHQHIPNAAAAASPAGGLYAGGKGASGSLSPPRSMSASPRDSTPRTVPKKTASIRRQFASPTASSTTSSSCPSPSTEAQRLAHGDEAQQHERKAAAAAASAAAHNAAMQRSSPLGGGGGGVSPMLHPHYYMYPPNNAAAAAAAAHAAAGQAAAYIPSVMSSVGGAGAMPPGLHSSPSYYSPYISTIAALQRNPMWMQYPGGGVLPVMSPHPGAGSRLGAPFHGFPYNMAAAAAAAAFGGGAPPPPHGMMHPGPAAMSYYEGAGPSERPRSPPKPTESTDLSMAAKGSMGGAAPSTSRSASQPTTTANNCIKDEQSSDVPLNLSKH